MVLSDTSATKSGLTQDVQFLCGYPDDYTTADITRNLNEAYKFSEAVVLSSMDQWQFRGEEATASLVANQREYVFPSNLLQIDRIEAKFDGTNPVIISRKDERSVFTPLSSESAIITAFSNNTDGCIYDTFDRSFKIYSGTIAAVTDGLKIWYTKLVTTLVSASDTPVLEEPFHRVLSLHASVMWAMKNDQVKLQVSLTKMLGERIPGTMLYTGLIGEMQTYYANRDVSSQTAFQPRTESYE